MIIDKYNHRPYTPYTEYKVYEYNVHESLSQYYIADNHTSRR